MLKQIEEIRQQAAQKIRELLPTGIDFELEVTIQSDNDSDLAIEARELDWPPDRHKETAWYSSQTPSDGSVTLYVE